MKLYKKMNMNISQSLSMHKDEYNLSFVSNNYI